MIFKKNDLNNLPFDYEGAFNNFGGISPVNDNIFERVDRAIKEIQQAKNIPDREKIIIDTIIIDKRLEP